MVAKVELTHPPRRYVKIFGFGALTVGTVRTVGLCLELCQSMTARPPAGLLPPSPLANP